MIAGNFCPGNDNLFEAGRIKTGPVVRRANVKKSNALDFKKSFNFELSCSGEIFSFEKVKC
jgi:hypothetical protein